MASFLPVTFGTSNKPVLVVATAIASGTTIYTATAGAANIDEIWIWAQNNHTANVDLVIGWGGVVDPGECIKVTIAFKSGLYLVVPGIRLNGGLAVKASASTASVISLFVNVNNYTA